MHTTAPAPIIDFSAYGIDSHWRHRTPQRQTMLVAYAHPDDESFGNAGTIAHYSQRGVAVHYACATRGECGTVDPQFLVAYPDIGALRTAEQLAAAQALGLAAVHFLGYRDSGMPGAADNDHPQALVQAPVATVARQLVALIRTLRPQVVLAFPPYGGYGHPDHIAMHHATLLAFGQAGDPSYELDGLAPWTPSKLYYSTFATRWLWRAIRVMRLLGKDPRKVGTNADIDIVRVAEEATPIHAVVAHGEVMGLRDRACLSHRSQLGGMGLLMKVPRRLRRLLGASESFTRVVPPPAAAVERDLFAGVSADRA